MLFGTRDQPGRHRVAPQARRQPVLDVAHAPANELQKRVLGQRQAQLVRCGVQRPARQAFGVEQQPVHVKDERRAIVQEMHGVNNFTAKA